MPTRSMMLVGLGESDADRINHLFYLRRFKGFQTMCGFHVFSPSRQQITGTARVARPGRLARTIAVARLIMPVCSLDWRRATATTTSRSGSWPEEAINSLAREPGGKSTRAVGSGGNAARGGCGRSQPHGDPGTLHPGNGPQYHQNTRPCKAMKRLESITYRPGDILRDTVREIRDILGDTLETLTLERIVIGLFFTGVKLSGGAGGLCFTPIKAVPEAVCCPSSARVMPASGKLRGRKAMEFVDEMLSGNPLKKTMGIAVLNALSVMCWKERTSGRLFDQDGCGCNRRSDDSGR